MSDGFGLIYVSAYSPRAAGLPNRPGSLLQQLRARDEVMRLIVVGRRKPSQFLRNRGGRPGVMCSRLTTTADGEEFVEHPWPFGRLEEEMLSRLALGHLPETPSRWVLWVADPKSATVFARLRDIPNTRLLRVFDAYDAWDLSPLVRGRWRRRAVGNGYRVAAQDGDVVFANTPLMARRMEALGASRVVLLRNAAPEVGLADDPPPSPDRQPYLVYVGRIHERVDAGLLSAVAEAFPEVRLRLIGPVEGVPDGWPELTSRPSVSVEGPIVGDGLRDILSRATALLLPHRVDDYTRSQDSMKAWDALAVGTPVVATSLPPMDSWPAGMATVAADPEAFVGGVRSALDGAFAAGRPLRLQYARANGWDVRAATAIRVINEVLDA